MRLSLIGMAVVALMPAMSMADSITIGGETFDNVLVRQSDSLYYIQKPQDGSVLSVPKSNVREVFLSQNPAERELLLNEWKKMNAVLTGVSGELPAGVADMQGAAMRGMTLPDMPGAGAADATAAMRKRAGDAMKAAAKKQEMEMATEYESVQLARPAGGRQPSAADIQKRMQEMTGGGGESPASAYLRSQASDRTSYSRGAAGATGVNGAMSGMGAMGGYGNAGGYGGMGAMGNMGGIGGGGFGIGGQSFSNISDLFSTIDDRLVGETPAFIGASGLSPNMQR